jgi:hypothetical protein
MGLLDRCAIDVNSKQKTTSTFSIEMAFFLMLLKN